MEVKLPTEGTRYVQALLLTATAYLQYRAHFLPAVAAYRGYGRPAVPKVPVQALRACLAIGHGTLPLPSVAWTHTPGDRGTNTRRDPDPGGSKSTKRGRRGVIRGTQTKRRPWAVCLEPDDVRECSKTL